MEEKCKVVYYTNAEEENIYNKIIRKLYEVGIPVELKGYRYLLTTIMQIQKDGSLIGQVTSGLYPKVADIHSVGVIGVVRAISTSIKHAFKNNNPYFKKIFLQKNKKPTNVEFIIKICKELEIY